MKLDLYQLKTDLIPRYNNFDKEYVGTTLTKIGKGFDIPVLAINTDSLPYYYYSNEPVGCGTYAVKFFISYDSDKVDEIMKILKKISSLFLYLVADLVNPWEDTSITVEGIVDMAPEKFIHEFVSVMS